MDAEALETEAQSAIASATTPGELDAARVRYLGRGSALKQALRGVRDREAGQVLNTVRSRLERALAERRTALDRSVLERSLAEERLDISLPGHEFRRGRLHPITQIRREVEEIFLGMGYEVVDGREVETVHYIFDQLNMGPGHVTRSPLHTFYLDDDVLLRTETSASQVRVMEERSPPVYMVSLGRVYRRDTPDPKRYPIFHQVEGLAVDEDITLADLKGTLLAFARAIFGDDRDVRLRPHFFPFTEPSIECDVSCFNCVAGFLRDGSRCHLCKGTGWIEILGAGMVDPNVFGYVREHGYDPERHQGFAFGMGIERIAMLKHEVTDLRLLYDNDVRFLEQFG